MDEQFKQLKAPTRTAAQQEASKARIRERLQRKPKTTSWHHYGIFAAACMIFIFLVTFSNRPATIPFNTAATSTINAVYQIQNYQQNPIYNMKAFYYIDRVKLNAAHFNEIEKVAAALLTSNDVLQSPLPDEEIDGDLLIDFKDGSQLYMRLYVADYLGIKLVNVETNQILDLRGFGSQTLMLLTLDERPFYEKLIRIVIGMAVLVITLYVMKWLQMTLPSRPQIKKRTIFAMMLSTLVYYWIISGLSLYYFGAKNGLFMLAGVLPFLLYHLRQYSKTKNRRYLSEMLLYFILAFITIFIVKL